MPKPIILSNGNLLIGFDAKAQVRDFYYPYVGLENHTGGHLVHRLGVWVDNNFSWFDDPNWSISLGYQVDTLVSRVTAQNDSLGVKIDFEDAVYNEKDIFIRQVKVTNLWDHPRLIKFFFHQQFELYESHRKDTAYYDPNHQAVIHYKGRRVFLINSSCEGRSFDDYSTGLFNLENREGTFKDAEDGILAKNPIEHGQVDSVIGFSLNLDPAQSKTLHYWVCGAKVISDALELNQYVLDKTAPYLLKTTSDFWHAWTNRQNFNFYDLDPTHIDLFKKSLLITRTHVDNRGGILASCDSDMLQYGRDNYSYVWPRDGAFSVMALDRAGDHEVARRFFQFCSDVVRPEGYFMHKYRPDLSLGSSWHPWVRNDQPQLPIQEDETALVIFALWKHYELTRDLEFIEGLYNSLIKKCGDFMVSYRDPQTGLPLGSYDIWEQDYATHTYTASTVFAALESAAKFAQLLGKSDHAARYRIAAGQIKSGIQKYLYDDKEGYFYKSIDLNTVDQSINRTIDASSSYSVYKFGILDPFDDRLARSFSTTLYHLGLTTLIGGIARFEGDWYYRSATDVPGNPWIITTLWLAQYYLAQVRRKEDLASVRRLLTWVVKHAMPSGVLSEQLDPHTGAQISAAPLTWSHSEYVTTILDYIEKIKAFMV